MRDEEWRVLLVGFVFVVSIVLVMGITLVWIGKGTSNTPILASPRSPSPVQQQLFVANNIEVSVLPGEDMRDAFNQDRM